MRKIIISSFLILSLLSTSILAGCNKKDPIKDPNSLRTVTYALESDINEINPIMEKSPLDGLVFRGLMKYDENNTPQKDLATDISVSKDGNIYTFKIAKGIKFHNGAELTAEDIVFTIRKIMDPDIPSKRKLEFQDLKDIKADDKYTVKMLLKKATISMLDKLTLGIVSQKAFKSNEDIIASKYNSTNNKPIGSGQFMVDSWDKGNSITLKSYTGYTSKEISKVDRLVFKLIPDSAERAAKLESGDVDVARIDQSDRARLESSNKFDIYNLPSAACTVLAYNFRLSFFRDLQIRKALNYAVDKEGIVNTVLGKSGLPAYSLLQMSEYTNSAVERYDYSLQNANNILSRAGWDLVNGTRVKDYRPLEFTISVDKNNKFHMATANNLVSAFQRIGVKANINAVSANEIDFERSDTVLLDVGSQYDPDNFLFDYLDSSQVDVGKNYGKYEDDKVDSSLRAERTAIDISHRKNLLKNLQKALADNPPYNLIAFADSTFAVSKKVKSIKLPSSKRVLGANGDGFLLNVGKWEVMSPKEYGVTVTPTATPAK